MAGSLVLVVFLLLGGLVVFEPRLRGLLIGIEPVQALALPAETVLRPVQLGQPQLVPLTAANADEIGQALPVPPLAELAHENLRDAPRARRLGARRLGARWLGARRPAISDDVAPLLPSVAPRPSHVAASTVEPVVMNMAATIIFEQGDDRASRARNTATGKASRRGALIRAIGLPDDHLGAFLARSEVLREGRPKRELAVCHAGGNRSIDLAQKLSGEPHVSTRISPASERSVSGGRSGLFGDRLARAAESQLNDITIYNERYFKIGFPGGDIPAFYGVCTDVIVRAYRALGIDLQRLVAAAGVGTGDTSIDHRRTSILKKFFRQAGAAVPISEFGSDYRAGDIVTYDRPQNSGSRFHIAIVSADVGPSGDPMIIHNRGWGVQKEDALFVDRITGHYRYAGPPLMLADAARVPLPTRRQAAVGGTGTRTAAATATSLPFQVETK